MEHTRAAELLSAERQRLERLLTDAQEQGDQERDEEGEVIVISDPAEPLTAQGVDDAIVAELSLRLSALARAKQRLANGTYGLSVLSGDPIPDERLEADPTAETTVEEARSPL